MSGQPAAAERPSHEDERRARRARAATPRRRLLADRVARWCVTGGGVAIIAGILGILLFILIEVAPLLSGADVEPGRTTPAEGPRVGALLTDEYRTLAAALDVDGWIVTRHLDDGRTEDRRPLLPAPADADEVPAAAPLAEFLTAPGDATLAATTRDGRLVLRHVTWEVTFPDDRRTITPVFDEPVEVAFPDLEAPLGAAAIRRDAGGNLTAAVVAGDSLSLARLTADENLFTGEVTLERTDHRGSAPVPVDGLLLDRDQHNLFGFNADGTILWWSLDDGEPSEPQVIRDEVGITAMTLLIGDRALVAGHDDGTLSIWFVLRQPDESFELRRIRRFDGLRSAIRLLAPSRRDKGFLAVADDGDAGLFYSTSARTLWRGSAPVADPTALVFAPKADGGLLAGDSELAEWVIDNPHPEVSLGALFGKVWYEGYPEPQYVWQSSGGSDDFEPKLSLTPLMIGTLKGTVYSLFLAIPLGVLGAMYTSQFMHHSLKRYVKPTVEIMAALPSVVLGFLAGLWLAPRVEDVLPALALMLLVLPVLVVLAGRTWRSLPLAARNRFPSGFEALLQVLVVGVGIWLCLGLNAPVEHVLFGGSFQDWLLAATGLKYDQRNAVVVGLAMGFAVIPIIFSIAEDAFSNVPRNLVSGSLALGANRWQTVTRVVLPSASPGIFSAIMIGFGRAVGETMIVLMATGNTPIMDWNPFNGFRTLSANIAVEIPEAPHGGTLYRTLFLAALLLFLFTFVTNTVAEIVRQRLRRRYAQL